MTQKPYTPVAAQIAIKCANDIKKSMVNISKEKLKFNGQTFYEINKFKLKSEATNTATNYKRCGYYTRIISSHGKYMLLARRM